VKFAICPECLKYVSGVERTSCLVRKHALVSSLRFDMMSITTVVRLHALNEYGS